MALQVGSRLGHYDVTALIGEGGMGQVYRATDTQLGRDVALKILPDAFAADPDRLARFQREAQVLASLNHPNIAQIHGIEKSDDTQALVLELVEGPTLADRIAKGPIPLDEALPIAKQIAEALEAAHEAGVIHRDLKPANIKVREDGTVKVLDFGLAKTAEPEAVDSAAETRSAMFHTQVGTVVGTVAYMSPEQVEGRVVGRPSDVFSLGSVLYEMFTGRRPFTGDSELSVRTAVLNDRPSPIRSLRSDVPVDLERVVVRCLEKSPEYRYQSGRELSEGLDACDARISVRAVTWQSVLRRPKFAVPLVLVLLALVGVGVWQWTQSSRVRLARETMLPEIVRLADDENYVGAYELAIEARRYIPTDPLLVAQWARITNSVSVHTDPPGARVSYKPYTDVDGAWRVLGDTPLDDIRLPRGPFRWQIEKDGYERREVAVRVTDPSTNPAGDARTTFRQARTLNFVLAAAERVPPGMISVDGRAVAFDNTPLVPGPQLAAFFIDKTEVTNAAYKEFVEAGGYDRPEFWTELFVRDGRELSWEEAVGGFRDATGRPGPAAWSAGTFEPGAEDHPVGGVSWYEAAAYAAFRGKVLPTVHHWLRAALPDRDSLETLTPFLVAQSNFTGEDTAPVGQFPGISAAGASDMAGNVAEWVWNAGVGDTRIVLGGHWEVPAYSFLPEQSGALAVSPWERPPAYGFRCAQYRGDELAEEVLAAVSRPPLPDYDAMAPLSDEAFEAEARFRRYDPTPLNAVVEDTRELALGGREERVTIDAAYDNERLIVSLRLPANVEPPYQTVLWIGSGGRLVLDRASDEAFLDATDFFVQAGRALINPVLAGTYERKQGDNLRARWQLPNARREGLVKWTKDVGRTLDYLETRDDIDVSRVAFAGLSAGANDALAILPFEDRFRAVILWGSGLSRNHARAVDAVTLAGRITAPFLMLHGRFDRGLSPQFQAAPLLELLGTADADKELIIYEEANHWPFPRNEMIRDNLDWLDRYLGPVN